MTCRRDSEDPRRCDGCGEFLWVSEDGWYCGSCGVTMPCTMRLLPPPEAVGPQISPRARQSNQSQI